LNGIARPETVATPDRTTNRNLSNLSSAHVTRDSICAANWGISTQRAKMLMLFERVSDLESETADMTTS